MVIAGPVRSSLSLKERGLLMRYLPDGEQMKKADQYTIQQIGVPSVVLMERAALKIVEVLEEKKKDLRRPLIVCGSGNNGGDGFAVARLLAEKGCHVDVLFTGRESSMTEECNFWRWSVQRSCRTLQRCDRMDEPADGTEGCSGYSIRNLFCYRKGAWYCISGGTDSIYGMSEAWLCFVSGTDLCGRGCSGNDRD